MLRHLRGPIPSTAFLLALLVAAYGWRPAAAPAAASGNGVIFPAGDLVDRACGGHLLGSFGPARLLVALVIAAIAGCLLYRLAMTWTGNRICSLLAAALMVLHPALEPSLSGPDAIFHALPAAFALGTLLLREHGWAAWRQNRPHLRFELGALGLFMAGLLSGAEILSLPLLLLLVDRVFHGNETRAPRREAIAISALYVVVALLFWHFDRPGEHPWRTLPAGFAERAARLVLLPMDGAPAVVVTVLLALGAAGALALGLRSLASHPRWVVVYAGFGLAWFFAAEATVLFGVVPKESGPQLLAFAGPGLILPALAWRVLLRMLPEPAAAASAAPVPERARLAPAALPAVPSALASAALPAAGGRGAVSVPEVREAVETAVGTAVETAVAAAWRALRRAESTRNGGAPRSAYAEEWDRYEAAWASAASDDGRKVLGEEWGNLELEQTVFDNYCRPYLAPASRVLEIGQGGGRFTSRIAPLVARVVCLDVSANMLRRAREDVPAGAKVSFVLSDGRGLAPIAAGSIDFCFAYDVFVHLDQEDIYLYLRDLRRVLRPGGRAAISFANLLDPLGFRQFEREAALHRTGRRSPGRINFLSPEIVRTLAVAAGLQVESLHLAANNRDVLAVLERGLA